ncbi:MAG: hypothetical protein QXP52_00175 [Candidatus Aenigmatarchaeota archaeon]
MSLVIAPKFDEATEYTFKWVQEVKEELQKQGYNVIFLSNGVKRKDVEETIKNEEIDLVVFYNHGNEDCLWGSHSEKVIDCDNIDLFKGKEIYTLACLSAKKLGVEAWKKGVKLFIGYDDTFVFTTTEEELFKECANSGILKKLRDKVSWKEAFDYMKKKFDEAIDKAKEFWTKTWLAHDRDCLRKYDSLQPPITKCFFRKIAIKLFGEKLGWKISLKILMGLVFFLIGYGVSLHDFAHQVWELKRTVLSLEGGYIGFFILFLGFILLLYDFTQF